MIGLHDVWAVVAGFVIGLLSGSMGIGGGVLMVPVLVIGFGLTQHVAQGTSLVAIIPTSVVGALTHHRRGNIVLRAAVWMGLAGALGALVGAAIALKLPKDVLARVFGVFLVLSAYRIWPVKPWVRARKPG